MQLIFNVTMTVCMDCAQDDGDQEALRVALRKSFVNMCRACPELVLQFTRAALEALPVSENMTHSFDQDEMITEP